MRKVSDESCRGNQNTYSYYIQSFFFQKSCRFCDNMEKYDRARQATGDSVMWRRKDAICMPDN
jgi:hypothetical protein